MEGTRIAFRPATYDRNRASEPVKRRVGPRTSSHGGDKVCEERAPRPDSARATYPGHGGSTDGGCGRIVVVLLAVEAEVDVRKVGLTMGDREAFGDQHRRALSRVI